MPLCMNCGTIEHTSFLQAFQINPVSMASEEPVFGLFPTGKFLGENEFVINCDMNVCINNGLECDHQIQQHRHCNSK